MGEININPIEIADDLANGEANSPAALLARNAILEARLKEAEGKIAHLQKAKNCYYDCVDKTEANRRIANAENAALDVVRPMVEQAEARAERLKTALEMVEWGWVSLGSGTYHEVCAWCRGFKQHGHKPDCVRQAALSDKRVGK